MTKAAGVAQVELARTFGVTAKTVQRWVEQGMPRIGEGRDARYDTAACYEWRIEQERKSALAIADKKTGPQNLKDARWRKVAAEAEMAELELAERRASMISIDDAEKLIRGPLENVRSKLNSLPNRWAPLLVGCPDVPTALKRLESCVQEAVAELAIADRDEDEQDAAP